MKYIIAVIQPHRLEAVRDALAVIGVQGMTVSEVRGFGRQKGQTEIYRGAEYTMQYVPKVKLELAVGASVADAVVEAIGEAARTGRIGDGKVFVLPLEHRSVEVDLAPGVPADAVVDEDRDPIRRGDHPVEQQAAALDEPLHVGHAYPVPVIGVRSWQLRHASRVTSRAVRSSIRLNAVAHLAGE